MRKVNFSRGFIGSVDVYKWIYFGSGGLCNLSVDLFLESNPATDPVEFLLSIFWVECLTETEPGFEVDRFD